MTPLSKGVTGLLAGLALLAATASAPVQAKDGRNTALAVGAVAGLAAGALIGSASANSGPDYIYPPAYYGPAPAYPAAPGYPAYGVAPAYPVYGSQPHVSYRPVPGQAQVYYAPPPVPRCYLSPIQRWDQYIGGYVTVGTREVCD